jgi:hypothetical protein
MGILILYDNLLSPGNGKGRLMRRIKQSLWGFVFCYIKLSITVEMNMLDYVL